MLSKHVYGTGAFQVSVRADHPGCRRRLSPYQSNPRKDVLEID
jgi:hypothetical protein